MRLKERETEHLTLRPLSKHEIDQRIEVLITDLALRSDVPGAVTETDELHPRPITARELVRRMRPFIVLN